MIDRKVNFIHIYRKGAENISANLIITDLLICAKKGGIALKAKRLTSKEISAILDKYECKSTKNMEGEHSDDTDTENTSEKK